MDCSIILWITNSLNLGNQTVFVSWQYLLKNNTTKISGIAIGVKQLIKTHVQQVNVQKPWLVAQVPNVMEVRTVVEVAVEADSWSKTN